MKRAHLADRRHIRQEDATGNHWATCFGSARMGSLELASNKLSIWIQVRGNSWIESKEGKFLLRPGDWIVLSKGSSPTVQANEGGICLGLSVSDQALSAMAQFSDFSIHVGQGQFARADVREMARLWYRADHQLRQYESAARLPTSLRSMLLQLERHQRAFLPQVELCPGASLGRKRQVFDRMQRTRQFMLGNCSRVVRIGELADQIQFSPWYFSKVFRRVYGYTPQKAASRIRLEHAASLLAGTSIAVGDVGASCGFDNNCSFARSFRARYGMTASAYRKDCIRRSQIAQTRNPRRAHHISPSRELMQPL
jgi:AraC family transcriptional regulator